MDIKRLQIENEAEQQKLIYNFNKRINEALQDGSYNDVLSIMTSYSMFWNAISNCQKSVNK